MTKLLEKAFAAAAKLPTEEQDALASALLSEIESEHRWDRLFAESEDLLGELAEEALTLRAADAPALGEVRMTEEEKWR